MKTYSAMTGRELLDEVLADRKRFGDTTLAAAEEHLVRYLDERPRLQEVLRKASEVPGLTATLDAFRHELERIRDVVPEDDAASIDLVLSGDTRPVACGYGAPRPGREAEDLRQAFERAELPPKARAAVDRVLEEVDARDSLAYLEEQDELRKEIGEAWLAGGVSVVEALRRKTRELESSIARTP